MVFLDKVILGILSVAAIGSVVVVVPRFMNEYRGVMQISGHVSRMQHNMYSVRVWVCVCVCVRHVAI